ncbi:MAG: serine--tRNA ligase, partial [Solobacterium sp.]|nr:serine--tRNA ligase [Solobacterium sp.]
MIDIQLIRDNPELVKENIRKKYQDEKLPLVDEVAAMDKEFREAKTKADALRGDRNRLSKEIGKLMGQAKKDPAKLEEAEAVKAKVAELAQELADLEAKEEKLEEEIKVRMMTIPQIMDPRVPQGVDDSENVEIERFGEPVVPDWEIPYHTEIMESLDGLDRESAGNTSGNGFYFLMGDVARLHSSIISYARDFMINEGFTYFIPPFMIHGDVVKG